ncbi:NUDIX domain-containing protein [Haematospirillum sp. H1815]|uniref:NUDIX domain-containing protein n=1 Tax=Haematospirillum sp. H1815 TaxID=2723108 RepID=UPI00143A6632|nr:NUDIX domain-containing protein [Haematospirillum sp. H1815]NKD76362.1 NUDIX domain-containing protein [Haematospirillum sp. H1815]
MSESYPSKVEILEKEPLLRAYSKVNRYHLRHELFSGKIGPVLVRDIIEHKHAIAVLLYDPQADAVVLIEQFRAPPHIAGIKNPWLLEVVAGVIEEGETLEDVCLRECTEETGLQPKGLFHIQTWFTTPGICTETVSLWCGAVDSTKAGGTHGLANEGEDIRVVVHPVASIRNMLLDSTISNGTTLIALQWLLLNYQATREKLARAQ